MREAYQAPEIIMIRCQVLCNLAAQARAEDRVVGAWRWRAVVRQARSGKGITQLRVVLGGDGVLGRHVESQMTQRFFARGGVAVVLRSVASPSPCLIWEDVSVGAGVRVLLGDVTGWGFWYWVWEKVSERVARGQFVKGRY